MFLIDCVIMGSLQNFHFVFFFRLSKGKRIIIGSLTRKKKKLKGLTEKSETGTFLVRDSALIMAVAENAGAKIGSSSQNLDNTVVSSDSKAPPSTDLEKSKPRTDSVTKSKESSFPTQNNDQTVDPKYQNQTTFAVHTSNGKTQVGQMENGGVDSNGVNSQQVVPRTVSAGGHGPNVTMNAENDNGGESFKTDMNDLVEILSKLNPMAEEFVPPSIAHGSNHGYLANGFSHTNNFLVPTDSANANGHTSRRVWIFLSIH